MKTPEEIKKDLAAWGVGVRIDIGGGVFVPPTPEYMLNGVRSSDVCRDALAYIQQLEAQVPQWISVKDRLPDENEYVLCWYTNKDGSKWHTVGFFNGYDDNSWTLDIAIASPNDTSVTHWMPLPEPPEGGENEVDCD